MKPCRIRAASLHLGIVLSTSLMIVTGASFARDPAAAIAPDGQKVIKSCESNWDANKADCSKVCQNRGRRVESCTIPADSNADKIVEYLETSKDWTSLPKGDGNKAKTEADGGKFVIGGMKAKDLMPAQKHGHVLVVVSGPLDPTHKKYPTAYWGTLGGEGKKKSTVNYAFRKEDRDRVEYFSRTLP